MPFKKTLADHGITLSILKTLEASLWPYVFIGHTCMHTAGSPLLSHGIMRMCLPVERKAALLF